MLPHLRVDMLLGQDISWFQKLLKEVLEDERTPVVAEEEKPEVAEPETATVVTRVRSQRQKQQQ